MACLADPKGLAGQTNQDGLRFDCVFGPLVRR